ncbi:hypothetical protein LCGC14_1993300, partial [marine sediment metagenome]
MSTTTVQDLQSKTWDELIELYPATMLDELRRLAAI